MGDEEQDFVPTGRCFSQVNEIVKKFEQTQQPAVEAVRLLMEAFTQHTWNETWPAVKSGEVKLSAAGWHVPRAEIGRKI